MIIKNIKTQEVFTISKRKFKALDKNISKQFKIFKTNKERKVISYFNIKKYQPQKILDVGNRIATKEFSGWDSYNKVKDQIANSGMSSFSSENIEKKDNFKQSDLKFKDLEEGMNIKLYNPYIYLTEYNTYTVVKKTKDSFYIINDNGTLHRIKKKKFHYWSNSLN